MSFEMLVEITNRDMKRIDAEDWKKVTAKVERIDYERKSSRKGYRYYPLVQYKYKIDGIVYHSDQLSFRPPKKYKNAISARNKALSYVNEDDTNFVDIMYNPINPQESVIEIDRKENFVFYFLCVICFLCVVGLINTSRKFYRYIRNMPPTEAHEKCVICASQLLCAHSFSFLRISIIDPAHRVIIWPYDNAKLDKR